MAQLITTSDLSESQRADLRAVVEGELAGQLPDLVLNVLREVVAGAEAGDVLLLIREGQMLTTTQAAKLLGVSRPRVAQLIDRGALSSERVGSHHRLHLKDVLARKRSSDSLEVVRQIGYSDGFPL